jgi:hypothetical protein
VNDTQASDHDLGRRICIAHSLVKKESRPVEKNSPAEIVSVSRLYLVEATQAKQLLKLLDLKGMRQLNRAEDFRKLGQNQLKSHSRLSLVQKSISLTWGNPHLPRDGSRLLISKMTFNCSLPDFVDAP